MNIDFKRKIVNYDDGSQGTFTGQFPNLRSSNFTGGKWHVFYFSDGQIRHREESDQDSHIIESILKQISNTGTRVIERSCLDIINEIEGRDDARSIKAELLICDNKDEILSKYSISRTTSVKD